MRSSREFVFNDNRDHGIKTSPEFFSPLQQGCQMVCFQTKNPNLGKFLRALEWKMMVYFMVTWNILRSFGIYMLWPFGDVVIIW
jgi:hypothetical protein